MNQSELKYVNTVKRGKTVSLLASWESDAEFFDQSQSIVK